MVQIITNSNGGGGGVGVYKYKGSVDYYEDLPTSGMKIGDTYNVVNSFIKDEKEYPAGTNVAWTGTDWDALGGSIDLSDYQKKLVEGDGIDLDQDTNEISVEATVISGAEKGATALQPNDNVSELVNDAGYLVESDLKQSDWGQSDSSAIDYIKNKPTIGNGTLTVSRNGVQVNTFSANQTSNSCVDISVPVNTSDLNNDSGYIDKTVSNLDNYTLSSNLCAVATSGKYCDLTGTPTIGNATLTIQKNGTDVNTFTANATTNVTANITVPTTVAELTDSSCYALKSSLCTVATSGQYSDLTGTPNLCAVATSGAYSDLSGTPNLCPIATSGKYCDITGTPLLCTVATSGKYCDLSGLPTIPTDNCQLNNGCGYTTCTGTLVAADLAPYAKCTDIPTDNCELANGCGYAVASTLCTVATTGKYCDLTGLPTIPTDNSELANGCGYAVAANLCAVATSGKYCDLTGTPTIPTDNCQLANGCGYAKASSLCTVATSGKYCDLTGTPTVGTGVLTIQKNGTCVDTFSANATANKTINITIPTDNCQLGNSCGYTTCTGTVVASDLTPYAKSADLCTVATTGKYCDLTGKPTIPTVIDALNSTCTTEALSAKQGCVLNSKIATLEARGRFLSNWNATTGLPVSFPEATPYTYRTGDYFDVTVVGATNYKPSGSSYTGAASTAVETDALAVGDTYVYDGTNWLLQLNHNITTSFSSISGSPYDNTCLSSALGDKANTSSLCTVATSGKYCDLTGTPTIPTDNCQLANGCGYITSSALSGYQLTCNMVCNLSGADNSHYPTAKAVADALSCAGAGDMLASVYDPCNKADNAFDYNNFINTPTLCAVATSGKYCDLTGTPSLATVATSGKYCDLTGTPTIPDAQIQSDWTQTCNACKDYIKNKPTLATVAISGKYCDLTGKPTIPTDNCQLANGCGYIKSISCSDVTTALGYTPYSSANPSGYTTCTGTLTASNISNAAYASSWNGVTTVAPSKNAVYDKIESVVSSIPTNNNQLSNGCGYTTCTGTLVASDLTPYAKTCDLATVATSGQYCDLTGLPTIPTNNNQLTNGCGYTTCIGTVVAGDLTPYSKTCDLAAVATSGKYCDLTGTPSLATVATSGKYCDLTGQPTIGTATLTIQKNGTTVNTFGANATSNVTANITVPTDTGDLTNGAGFITGITSGDVTTALGYTPYNSSNPSGYTSCTGTLTASNISDAAFSSAWDGVTDVAPSKNAIYDVLGDVETLLAAL